jgi:hypothetical protein
MDTSSAQRIWEDFNGPEIGDDRQRESQFTADSANYLN